MSPPEVWGPAVWTLFHTLIEQMNYNAYPHVIGSMFGMFIRICKFLPCPDCSRDASNFLAKIKLSDYKTKDDFKNMLYLFHNWVNAKKRKPLYNYSDLQKYSGFNLIFVLNNFIAKYNTKGNMKLLTESFQRNFVVKDFVSWFKAYARAFVQPVITNNVVNEQPVNEEVSNEEPVNEEPVNEEPVNEEEVSNEEQPINEEESTINEEPTINEESTINENVIITDEIHLDENKVEKIDITIQENIVIEEPNIIQQPKKKRKGKSNKK